MFSILTAAVVTFIFLPVASATTTPWIVEQVSSGYRASSMDEVMLVWKLLLAALIFAAVRAGLKLLFSAASLALAFKLIGFMQGR